MADDYTYLGDAVYIRFDGYMFEVRCAAPACVIYLEPSVADGLIRYINETRRRNAELLRGASDGKAEDHHNDGPGGS